MKSVLIQGASGFVASYLVPSLRAIKAKRVILVDRKPTSSDLLLKLSGNGHHVETYLSDNLTGLPIVPSPDIVISLAGITNVDQALLSPREAFEGNLAIAVDLAEWLRTEAGGAKLVFMSSDEVLGDSKIPSNRFSENSRLSPTQPYAASKAAAEVVLGNYRDVFGLNILILRSCNLVGGNQRARKLIPVAVKHLLANEPIPIYGDGNHQREWMAVEDVCSAIFHLINNNAEPGVYQAASGTHLSIMQVVKIVSQAIGRPLLTRHVTGRSVHDKCYSMSTEKLSTLGWKPRIDPRKAMRTAAQEMARSGSADSIRLPPDLDTEILGPIQES